MNGSVSHRTLDDTRTVEDPSSPQKHRLGSSRAKANRPHSEVSLPRPEIHVHLKPQNRKPSTCCSVSLRIWIRIFSRALEITQSVSESRKEWIRLASCTIDDTNSARSIFTSKPNFGSRFCNLLQNQYPSLKSRFGKDPHSPRVDSSRFEVTHRHLKTQSRKPSAWLFCQPL